MLLCLGCVGCWIYFIASGGEENDFFPFIIASSLGLIFTLAIHLAFESKQVKNGIKIPVWIVVVVGILLYYFHLKNAFLTNNTSYCTFFGMLGLGVIGFLMVSTAQVWAKNDNQRFLLFNRHLFVNYLLAAAYTLVLLVGFILAVLALDKLFGINVNAKVYGYLAVIFIGLFFTTYFLASIPKPDEEIKSIPAKGLKILAQYILVPIVIIYALIILAYSIKNIFSPSLSAIWTQELIWWFYVIGYFTFLINLAVEVPETLTKFGHFGKGFLYILVPLTILVLFSIGMNMYIEGITELKYIVASMSLYLFIIAIYLLFNNKKDYRWVSWLLIIFTLLATYGPINACKISIKSIEKKLILTLENNSIIQNGELVSDSNKLSEEDVTTIQNSLNFLQSRKDSFILELPSGAITGEELEMILGNRIIPDKNNIYIPYKTLTDISLPDYTTYIGYIDYENDNQAGRYLQLSQDRKKLEWRDHKQVFISYDIHKILTPVLKSDPRLENRKVTLDESNIQLDFYINELNYRYEEGRIVVDFIRGFGLLSEG
jgi:hypothetical protein